MCRREKWSTASKFRTMLFYLVQWSLECVLPCNHYIDVRTSCSCCCCCCFLSSFHLGRKECVRRLVFADCAIKWCRRHIRIQLEVHSLFLMCSMLSQRQRILQLKQFYVLSWMRFLLLLLLPPKYRAFVGINVHMAMPQIVMSSIWSIHFELVYIHKLKDLYSIF